MAYGCLNIITSTRRPCSFPFIRIILKLFHGIQENFCSEQVIHSFIHSFIHKYKTVIVSPRHPGGHERRVPEVWICGFLAHPQGEPRQRTGQTAVL